MRLHPDLASLGEYAARFACRRSGLQRSLARTARQVSLSVIGFAKARQGKARLADKRFDRQMGGFIIRNILESLCGIKSQ